jgi:hypothetical protein
VLALKSADELETLEMCAVVSGAGSAGAGGREESLLDVIPDGAGSYARRSGELGQVEGVGIGEHRGYCSSAT